MCIITLLKKIRDTYVKKQVSKLSLPEFETTNIVRKKIIFSGRVQKVGFRAEVRELATKLGLTGFCNNLENGDVLVELQGQENRIQFLITFMESLKRIKITKKIATNIPLYENEQTFVMLGKEI